MFEFTMFYKFSFIFQGVAIIEYVMEHLATAFGMDPLEFRMMNMIETSQGQPNPLPGSTS